MPLFFLSFFLDYKESAEFNIKFIFGMVKMSALCWPVLPRSDARLLACVKGWKLGTDHDSWFSGLKVFVSIKVLRHRGLKSRVVPSRWKASCCLQERAAPH